MNQIDASPVVRKVKCAEEMRKTETPLWNNQGIEHAPDNSLKIPKSKHRG